MLKNIIGRLANLRLTLWLLLLLAVTAAAGTFDLIPQGLEKSFYTDRYGALGEAVTALGLNRFHQSLPYRGLFALLLVNLSACAAERSLSGFGHVFGRGTPSAFAALHDREAAKKELAARGFRIGEGERIAARRRPWAFAGYGLTHLTPLLIVVGAVWGSEGGVIYTRNIHVGAIESTFYDWKAFEDSRLPFAVKVESLRREWYWLNLRLALATASGEELPPVETVEGRRFAVPGSGFEMIVDRFDPDLQDITYRLFTPRGQLGPFTRSTMGGAPVAVSPVAFRGDERKVTSRLIFYAGDGRELNRAEVAVNHPAEIDGHRIFLTAWGADDAGMPFVGLQVTKDPGQWLVWAGSVLLTAGVLLMLFAEGAWVAESDGKLVGRSSRGRRAFAEELESIAGGKS